jgi:predicted site-specific integrase-resolvase
MDYLELSQITHLWVAEAASFFGVSEKTIRRWHREGLIQDTRLKGSPLIERNSLLGLIERDKDAGATVYGG